MMLDIINSSAVNFTAAMNVRNSSIQARKRRTDRLAEDEMIRLHDVFQNISNLMKEDKDNWQKVKMEVEMSKRQVGKEIQVRRQGIQTKIREMQKVVRNYTRAQREIKGKMANNAMKRNMKSEEQSA